MKSVYSFVLCISCFTLNSYAQIFEQRFNGGQNIGQYVNLQNPEKTSLHISVRIVRIGQVS